MRRRGALVVVIAIASAIVASCSRGDGGYPLTAYFTKGISLYEGSDVRVLGLPAGTIENVRVERDRVRVDMTISDDVPVPAEVQATIVPLSLIGERYVQLFPAWTEGQPRAKAGAVIPLDRTSVPVEPDEALAALKEFLDTLDPDATGRLVHNLATDLQGNGQALNDALGSLSDLARTFAEKDDELARIVDHFDRFTATLATREQQLGAVLDGFATTAEVLADERGDIERLVKALASVSVDGLDLVSEHRTRLEGDLQTLTRTLQSVIANLDSVRALLSAAPVMVAGEDLDGQNEGLRAAYDPEFHRIDLRNSLSPVASDLLAAIGLTGVPVCVPVDTKCPPPAQGPAAPAGAGEPATTTTAPAVTVPPATSPPVTVTTTTVAPATSAPVPTIVDLLGSGGRGQLAASAVPTDGREPSGLGGLLRRAGRFIAEVLA